jgi:hypothetical protein
MVERVHDAGRPDVVLGAAGGPVDVTVEKETGFEDGHQPVKSLEALMDGVVGPAVS